MAQLDKAVKLVRNRFSVDNIYANPALLHQFIQSSNRIDLLKEQFIKQLNVPLLELFKAFEGDERISISEDFMLSVNGFAMGARPTKFYAYCFGMKNDDVFGAYLCLDHKFCYYPCKIAYFSSQAALQAFLATFTQTSICFPITVKTAVTDPSNLIPRFKIFKISRPPVTKRQFRQQHFGHISQILEKEADWYLRVRHDFLPENAARVEDEEIQRQMLDALFSCCRRQMTREQKNAIRKALRAERKAEKQRKERLKRYMYAKRPGARRSFVRSGK